jgi:DNA-binding transcriptional LysR family regulator
MVSLSLRLRWLDRGIAASPDFLTEAHIASGALVCAGQSSSAGSRSFCPASARRFPPRKVRALIEILVERFG